VIELPASVGLVEVAPRDGLQSFKRPVSTADKVRLIDRLSDAGLPTIEVTGFAHPRAVPQLADAEEVCATIRRRPGTVYRGLVPNARGALRGVETELDELAGLITVSSTYLAKNQNMTRAQAIEQAIESFRIADGAGRAFVMAVGVALWCTYEGVIPPGETIDVIGRLHSAGIRRFYIAGSAGMEDPAQVNSLFHRLRREFPDAEFGYHIHNLAGTAMANVLAALEGGAAFLEGAICGIGGGMTMPRELGAIGNLATEDLATFLAQLGVETGVDPDEVVRAARDIAALLGITPESRTGVGVTRAEIMALSAHG
jgi:hydroxymethylglutaryl-CoA lyase